MNKYSIVIPAKNEYSGLSKLLPQLKNKYPSAEIIVVNDGSTDDTLKLCQELDIKCISHKFSLGNGAAIKTGARNATQETIVFMDGDGQHKPDDIALLVDQLNQGYDMVVGARDCSSQACCFRQNSATTK